jgi:hypothetical protein
LRCAQFFVEQLEIIQRLLFAGTHIKSLFNLMYPNISETYMSILAYDCKAYGYSVSKTRYKLGLPFYICYAIVLDVSYHSSLRTKQI